MTALDACIERVRSGDPDRFAALMATPARMRARLWPLYAVNLEIARAPWASAEPMIGEMRLQWWIDALEVLGRDGQPPAHELGAALNGLRPVAAALAGIAEARRQDCWRAPFDDAAALWAYLDATSGALYAAAGDLLETPSAVLRDFGRAAGLASWFLAAPELQSRGIDPLPAQVGVLAADGLAQLERAARELPAAARAAALPGWEARHVLARALQSPGRVLAADLRGSEFSRRFNILRAAFRA